MNKSPKIVVIGSANIDLIMRVQRVPKSGETLPQGRFSTAAGGKGANQAVTLALLGADVEFIGRIGEDYFGEMVIRSLHEAGVSISHIVLDNNYHTGTVVILVDSEGQNAMIPDYGSNLCLCPEDIDEVTDLIRTTDLVLLQHEVPESANLKAISIAEESLVPVIINPAPILPSNIDSLKRSYLITPNLVEAEALARVTGASLSFGKTEVERAKEAASVLLRAGIGRIVVTIGDLGSIYVSSEMKMTFGAFHVSPVDATAAGDSFTAALSYGIASGKSIEDSILFASATAAITVSRAGAQPSLPTMEEVQNFLKSNTIGKQPE